MKVEMCGCWGRRRGRKEEDEGGGDAERKKPSSSWNLFIDLRELEAATGDFSEANLLGQGGFGPVYKVFFNRSNMCFCAHLAPYF